jgi:hypothetical protein
VGRRVFRTVRITSVQQEMPSLGNNSPFHCRFDPPPHARMMVQLVAMSTVHVKYSILSCFTDAIDSIEDGSMPPATTPLSPAAGAVPGDAPGNTPGDTPGNIPGDTPLSATPELQRGGMSPVLLVLRRLRDLFALSSLQDDIAGLLRGGHATDEQVRDGAHTRQHALCVRGAVCVWEVQCG